MSTSAGSPPHRHWSSGRTARDIKHACSRCVFHYLKHLNIGISRSFAGQLCFFGLELSTELALRFTSGLCGTLLNSWRAGACSYHSGCAKNRRRKTQLRYGGDCCRLTSRKGNKSGKHTLKEHPTKTTPCGGLSVAPAAQPESVAALSAPLPQATPAACLPPVQPPPVQSLRHYPLFPLSWTRRHTRV